MGALFQDLTPDIKVTVAEYSERHSMSPTYIHKLNLGVNMSYNMRHALSTMFACCRWVVLSVNCFCLHTTVMLTVCYINRQPGRGYHYSDTNACGVSAASKKGHKSTKGINPDLKKIQVSYYLMRNPSMKFQNP